MQITDINGDIARCEAKGIQRDVNLFLMRGTPLTHGDFVMVHVGYAIQKVEPRAAQSAWVLYDQMLSDEESPHA